MSVIHALPEDANSSSGVITEELSSFISKENASAIAIYRHTGMNETFRQKIRDYALKQVGKPFDKDFLLSTDDRLYCTELIIKAFKTTDLDITTNLSPIRVMLIDEPVIPPDHLRHLQQFKLMKF